MIELYVTYGPWILSGLTVGLTMLQGNKYRHAWSLTLVNQSLWLLWIISAKMWGFMPLNIAMWVMCIRNHIKWRRES